MDVVVDVGRKHPVGPVEVDMDRECRYTGLPLVPVGLDGTKLPVVVGTRHIGIDVEFSELSPEISIERGIAIKDHVVDDYFKLNPHAVAEEYEGFHC